MHSMLRYCIVLMMAVGARVAAAQTLPPTDAGLALESLALRAAVVFTGEVVEVHAEAAARVVTMRVDSALKGSPGASYTVREWVGVTARFYVGQRAIFFLHAPVSPGALAGPVDGMDGVVALTPMGGALGADLRRLQTRVQRPMRAPMAALAVMPLAAVEESVRRYGDPESGLHEPVLPGRLPRPVGRVEVGHGVVEPGVANVDR